MHRFASRLKRPVEHHELGELPDALRGSPLLERRHDVGPDQQESGRLGKAFGERGHRIDGVRWSLPLDLDRVDRKPWVIAHHQPNHFESLARRAVAGALQWLGRIGNEPEDVERERLRGIDRRQQMSVMGRVERSAEDAEPHRQGGGGTPAPAPLQTVWMRLSSG